MARANKKISVMLIEDEVFDVQRIKKTIKPFEDRIMISDIVSNGRAAVDLLKKHPYKYDVIIMDFQISGGLMGEKLIRKIKQIDSTLQVIVVTKMTINMTDYAFANSLLEAGANWYCTKYPGDWKILFINRRILFSIFLMLTRERSWKKQKSALTLNWKRILRIF